MEHFLVVLQINSFNNLPIVAGGGSRASPRRSPRSPEELPIVDIAGILMGLAARQLNV